MIDSDRWISLMGCLRFKPSLDCFEKLSSAYSEPHRFYHTLKHIEAMLVHFDVVKDHAEHPAEVEISIWFHDAIYKTMSKSNEQDSAEWAKAFLLSQGHDEEGADRVYRLIMATRHKGIVEGNDEKLIVDIDLTILGTPPDVYDEFEQNVRKEYKFVPSLIYRKKRKEVLRSFLNNSSIYHLEYFQEKYEEAARSNISRAIDSL